MNESTENIPKTLYDTRLYKELYEMWKVYHTTINHCNISNVIAEMSETLSKRIAAMLTSIMKNLPISDGCKSLILMEDDPSLYKKKINCNDEYCFVIMWHSSGILYVNNYTYWYFLSYIDKKEREFINGLLYRPDIYNCSLTDGFDYEFEKIKSDKDIEQMVQENAQNEINKKFCNRIWRNTRGIFRAYRKHFDHDETPLITRYTLSKVSTMYNQHAECKLNSKDFIDHFTCIRYTSEQKINNLLKQISSVEKLIMTIPTVYTRFDKFKQHITAHIIQLMLDEENSELSLRKRGYRYNWVELTPVIDLYPELIKMDKRIITTPGYQLYWLVESILTKYTNLTKQTLLADMIYKNTAALFVPTEPHTNSILQDISTCDHLDGDTYSTGGIKQVSIPITETDMPDPAIDYSERFKDGVSRDDIIWELFRAVEPIYEKSPDDREHIENYIKTAINDIISERFADPNSTEFKQYIDACKTCISNVKANVTAIKDALLSSNDPDFIEYLYNGKHICKKEYNARIKQIEEQDNTEVTV